MRDYEKRVFFPFMGTMTCFYISWFISYIVFELYKGVSIEQSWKYLCAELLPVGCLVLSVSLITLITTFYCFRKTIISHLEHEIEELKHNEDVI